MPVRKPVVKHHECETEPGPTHATPAPRSAPVSDFADLATAGLLRHADTSNVGDLRSTCCAGSEALAQRSLRTLPTSVGRSFRPSPNRPWRSPPSAERATSHGFAAAEAEINVRSRAGGYHHTMAASATRARLDPVRLGRWQRAVGEAVGDTACLSTQRQELGGQGDPGNPACQRSCVPGTPRHRPGTEWTILSQPTRLRRFNIPPRKLPTG